MGTSNSYVPFWIVFLVISAYFGSWPGVLVVVLLYLYSILFDRFYLIEEPLPENDFEVCIVGAGFAGIAMAIKCKKMGIKYFLVESSDELGGTWRDNVYPGCGSDVQSNLYCYSFEPNPNWSRAFPEQPEVLAYLKNVAAKYQIRINYNSELKHAVWCPSDNKYSLTFADGSTRKVNFLISGTGALSKPVTPEFKGQSNFGGPAFHSAQWDKSVNLKNKRVAVIGTGASAVQIVPTICDSVDSLSVFQRTAGWVAPRLDHPIPEFVQTLYTRIPGFLYASRLLSMLLREGIHYFILRNDAMFMKPITKIIKTYIRIQINDPLTAEKLIPEYAMGCKRITPSDVYLNCFNRSNVKLVTSKIVEFQKEGIRTADGTVHGVDVVVYATGFSPLQSYIDAFGVENGEGKSLNQILGNNPKSFLGIMYPELPNFFTLVGPNSYSAYTSVIWSLECQINYIVECMRIMVQGQRSKLTVRPRAVERFQEFVTDHMKNKSYHAGCVSWYKGNKDGSNFTLWPSHLLHYWWITKKVDSNDFDFA